MNVRNIMMNNQKIIMNNIRWRMYRYPLSTLEPIFSNSWAKFDGLVDRQVRDVIWLKMDEEFC